MLNYYQFNGVHFKVEKKRILIVDDIPEIRMLIKVRLEMAGYQVVEAENGGQGCLVVEATRPDLIITDYTMPVMNGIQFSRYLKSNPGTKNLPIIMLSSFPFGKDQCDEINSIGVDYCMMKPYEFEPLFEKLNQLLSLNLSEDSTVPSSFGSFEGKKFPHFKAFTHAFVEINGDCYLSRIQNVSQEELSLLLPHSLEIGSCLRIRFLRENLDFSGHAKVVWINSGIQENNKYLAGLEIKSDLC